MIKKLLANKIGIILAVVQLILFWFISANYVGIFELPHRNETWLILFIFVFMINLPAIVLAGFICYPIHSLISSETFTNLMILISSIMVIFQWLIIGKMISNFLNSTKLMKIPLKDE